MLLCQQHQPRFIISIGPQTGHFHHRYARLPQALLFVSARQIGGSNRHSLCAPTPCPCCAVYYTATSLVVHGPLRSVRCRGPGDSVTPRGRPGEVSLGVRYRAVGHSPRPEAAGDPATPARAACPLRPCQYRVSQTFTTSVANRAAGFRSRYDLTSSKPAPSDRNLVPEGDSTIAQRFIAGNMVSTNDPDSARTDERRLVL